MTPTKPQSSFLVSCPGAYLDSGLGTGGLVCVHQGVATVIDSLDSTGLTVCGDVYYRHVRPLKAIVGYDNTGIRSLVRLPDARDGHDIRVRADGYAIVSTGMNLIRWYDPFGRPVKTWQAPGDGDAWHLNCLEETAQGLWVAAFGDFPVHRGWQGRAPGAGFVMHLDSGERVVQGLSGPHNPRFVNGTWVVCDSLTYSLVVAEPGGGRRQIALAGFTRGLAYDDDFYYVGESANRKDPAAANQSHIVVISRTTATVVTRLRIPFPEIYDILPLPPAFAEWLSTRPGSCQVDLHDERVAALESQLHRQSVELDNLRRLNRQMATPWLTRLVRKVRSCRRPPGPAKD